jgi:RNA polymerase sigma factor (TIGR02999 family)
MTAEDVTQLLQRWRDGDQQAHGQLNTVIYDELRKLAGSYLRRERSDHTLQSTALVNEAYMRLVQQDIAWQNRAHFFGIAAQIMRRILVDHARGHLAAKRGSGAFKLSLDEAIGVPAGRDLEIVALDTALKDLANFDEQQAKIVELRFFAGLSVEETAEALGVSASTVKRDWVAAKAWLFRQLSKKDQ